MAQMNADPDVACAACGMAVIGIDDNGRLLTSNDSAYHADGTPHDTRVKDSGIYGNVDLGWFSLREYELDECLRDTAVANGDDPDDEDGPAYLPSPTLKSAWASWLNASDEERMTYLRLTDDIHPLFAADRMAQAERDLALALRLFGEQTPLESVFVCPITV